MPIEIRHGKEAELYSKAGAMIGQAQAAQAQWELEKNLMLQRQDFEQQLRLRQMEFDKINLANEWEIKAAMMRNEIDFREEEKERLERIASLNNKLQAIDKAEQSGMYDADTLANAKLEIQLELASAKAGGKVPLTQIPMHQTKPQTLAQKRRELEAIVGPTEAEGLSLTELEAEAARITELGGIELTGKEVMVRSPEGIVGTLDEAELGLPQYAGYTIIDENYMPAFKGGSGGKFGAIGETGEWEKEPGLLSRKVGSIEDLYNWLTKKRGSIADLVGKGEPTYPTKQKYPYNSLISRGI